MPRPHADDEENKPLDPNIENVRRKMLRFMGINLGLLVLALIVVVAALVYKARKTASPPPAAANEIPVPAGSPLTGEIVLPAGSKIVSQSLSGSRLSIDAELSDGSRVIFVYDTAERRIVGQFAVRNR